VISKAEWKSKYNKEIERAISARKEGNEGMARVCARRAAGIVIGEYLDRRGYTHLSYSAYDRLSLFNSLPDVEDQLKGIANHFLLRVNPDHQLPVVVDLVNEVQDFARILLMEKSV
jgi:hypothetical protein